MLKSKVLSFLESNRDTLITGGELAGRFGVSRNAVWKAVLSLQKEGFEIEILKNSGYRYLSDNDVLSKEIIQNNLTARVLGGEIEILKTVDSTNLYLKRKNLNELNEGLVIISDAQTSGKGRMSRTFYSPGGEGVYMSVLLKPAIDTENVQFLTICAAVAICRAIKNVCGINVDVKWVNDIYYGNKKLCGILTEASVIAEMHGVEYVVVGIGVNMGEVSREVAGIATSVYQIVGEGRYRNKLIAEIINRLENVYIDFIENNKKREILEEYMERLFILNSKVKVNNFKEIYEADVIGIDDSGALIVMDEHNKTIHLQSGEVTLIIEGNN